MSRQVVRTWTLWGMEGFKVMREGEHLWIDSLLFLENVTERYKSHIKEKCLGHQYLFNSFMTKNLTVCDLIL